MKYIPSYGWWCCWPAHEFHGPWRICVGNIWGHLDFPTPQTMGNYQPEREVMFNWTQQESTNRTWFPADPAEKGIGRYIPTVIYSSSGYGYEESALLLTLFQQLGAFCAVTLSQMGAVRVREVLNPLKVSGSACHQSLTLFVYVFFCVYTCLYTCV